MARYIKEMQLYLDEQEVKQKIDNFLESMDFYPTIWNNEACFGADLKMLNGLPAPKNLKNIYFFKYYYERGILHFEAWVREGNRTEINPAGFRNIDMSTPFLKSITDLEKQLIDSLPEGSVLKDSGRIPESKAQKAATRNDKALILLRIAGVASLMYILYQMMIRVGN